MADDKASGLPLPYAGQAALLAPTGGSLNLAKRWQDTDRGRLAASTPYGPMEKELNIAGATVPVPFICPFAFLFTACQESSAFRAFLLSSLGGATGGFVLYLDDVRPGNQLRPDKGRCYYALYWSLLQRAVRFMTR